MKTKFYLIAILCLVMASSSLAQEKDGEEMQTLFGTDRFTFGGYGGPQVAYSSFDSRDIWLVGGKGGAIINHCFVIGGAGYGITNPQKYENLEFEGETYPNAYINGGYGGFLMEGIIWPKKLVHVSIPVIIGAGGLMFTDKLYPDDSDHDMDDHIITYSSFFVLEPGIEIELNVIKFMRLTAGVSYRYAPNVDLPSISSNAFNSLNASVSLKFGSF